MGNNIYLNLSIIPAMQPNTKQHNEDKNSQTEVYLRDTQLKNERKYRFMYHVLFDYVSSHYNKISDLQDLTFMP